jgi:hypothetical protein
MAAPFQNYDGGTFLSDLVTRPEFLAYISEEIFERCAWIQSGVMVRNSALDCRAGGVRVRVPFFQPINPTEEIIRSDATWGTSGAGYLTPQKVTADEQIMTIMHRGFSYAVDDLSAMGSGADPMAAIRGYLTRAILKLRTTTLLAHLGGLFDTALADNEIDKCSGSSAPDATNYLSSAVFAEARAKLGERGEDITAVAMHSSVYYYLVQVGALTFSSSSLVDGGQIQWGGGGINLRNDDVAYFMGARVIVDDMLAPLNEGTTGEYPCFPVYCFGGGVVMEGVQQELRTEVDRNILSKQDVMSLDYHYGHHIMGTSWSAAGDNPTNTDLETGTNWGMVYQTSKLIPIVRVKVNSPIAGTAYV